MAKQRDHAGHFYDDRQQRAPKWETFDQNTLEAIPLLCPATGQLHVIIRAVAIGEVVIGSHFSFPAFDIPRVSEMEVEQVWENIGAFAPTEGS